MSKLTRECVAQLRVFAAHDTEIQLVNYPATLRLLHLGLAEEIPGNLGRTLARITDAGRAALASASKGEGNV